MAWFGLGMVALDDIIKWVLEGPLRWKEGDSFRLGETLLLILFLTFSYGAGLLAVRSYFNLRSISHFRVPRALAKRTYYGTLLLTVITAGLLYHFLMVESQFGYLLPAVILPTLGAVYGRLGVMREKARREALKKHPSIPPEEVVRPKTPSDKWVMVVGMEQSGKSLSVDRTLDDFLSKGLEQWVISGNRRDYEDDNVRLSEFELTHPDVGKRVMRIWETRQIEEGGDLVPDIEEFDGIIIVADPVQQEVVIDTFPSSIGYNSSRKFDVKRLIADVHGALEKTSRTFSIKGWILISHCDLLRFSTYPPLVEFPIGIGPAWVEQFSVMGQMERDQLANILEIKTASSAKSKVLWDSGSPYIVGTSPRGTSAGFEGLSLSLLNLCY